MESENSQVSEKSGSNERLANYLRDAAKTTVKKYLSHFQFRVFKESYPTLVQHDRKQLKILHQQLINQLGNSIAEDLNHLFKAEKVYQSLQKLDEAISKQENRTQGWRPSGNPEEDLRDHLCQVKLKHKQRLLKVFQDMEKENEELLQGLSENDKAIQITRKEIKDTNSKLNVHFSEWEEACRNPIVPHFVP